MSILSLPFIFNYKIEDLEVLFNFFGFHFPHLVDEN